MMKSRTYLTVPFAQKDEAKALGARWDPARKRWYVPEGVDTAAFQRWGPDSSDAPESASGASAGNTAKSRPRRQESPGVVIPPTDPNFVPYSGEAPPWE